MHSVEIPTTSGIYKLMENTCILADLYDKRDFSKMTKKMLWSGVAYMKVYDLLWAIKDNSAIKKYLSKSIHGGLDCGTDIPSQAKDSLWEVEVFVKLDNAGLSPMFEEPDMSFQLDKKKTGIACKKIYSKKNTINTINKAIRQIASSTHYGIIAINLDKLAEAYWGEVKAVDKNMALDVLTAYNRKFAKEHEAQLVKLFKDKNLIAALFSSSTL